MVKDKIKSEIDPRILEIASKVISKRPKTVLDHIIEHGFITTEELEKLYGYKHPPRAIRDVREQGIPLTTYRVKATDGRSIAAYCFDDFSKVKHNRLGGREVFSKEFKALLVERNGSRCTVCSIKYPERYLQIDHRIPYEVMGDEIVASHETSNSFMLICATCNRKKSWSCENCNNWKEHQNPSICSTCYWTSPEKYDHIAEKPHRRMELVFEDSDVKLYENLAAEAEIQDCDLPTFVLRQLKNKL